MKNINWLKSIPIAHRGLHNNKDIPENSIPAFENAVKAGYNIELDVFLTKDNKLIVHHDELLDRSCNINGYTIDLDSRNLQNYKLFGTNYHIPTLEEVLLLVDAKVGLVIEIKTTKMIKETCSAVWKILSTYKGNYCIESFNPLIVRWFAHHHPLVIIGQLYSERPHLFLINRMLNQAKVVDFLAVSINLVQHNYFKKIKRLHPKKVLLTWTVKTYENLNIAKKLSDNYIFETNDKNYQYISAPII